MAKGYVIEVNPTEGKSMKKRRNPGLGLADLKLSKTSALGKGLALAGGALLVGVVAQNLVPEKWRDGLVGAAAMTAVALGTAWAASKVGFLRSYSTEIKVGGIAAAVLGIAAPKVLPMLDFNLAGKITGLAGLRGLDSRRLLGGGRVGAFDARRLLAAGSL